MRSLVIALTLALIACNGTDDVVDTSDTDTDTDTDADTDADTDTDVPCTPDMDQDGFCPPEDCDDNDIFTNPAFDEAPDDDKDNNCDGRIDELFSRVIVVDRDARLGVSLTQVDPLGDFKGKVGVTAQVGLTYATLDRDLKTFVGFGYDADGLAGIWKFDHNGTFTHVASIPEDYEWLNDAEEEDPPPIIGDMTMHPDGYYLVAAGDRLLKFDETGAWSTIAQWACLEEDESHEVCVTALATDTETREVLLLGYFGGVATWHPDDGFAVITASNPEEPGPQFRQAQHKRFGTTFALAPYTDAEEGGSFGMFRWNAQAKEMRFLGRFPDPLKPGVLNVQSFSIEDDTGDFYAAVNANPTGTGGAWDNQIWRMTADGKNTGRLHATVQDESDSDFYQAAVIHYTQD